MTKGMHAAHKGKARQWRGMWLTKNTILAIGNSLDSQ